jgi:hypothetical protein
MLFQRITHCDRAPVSKLQRSGIFTWTPDRFTGGLLLVFQPVKRCVMLRVLTLFSSIFLATLLVVGIGQAARPGASPDGLTCPQAECHFLPWFGSSPITPPVTFTQLVYPLGYGGFLRARGEIQTIVNKPVYDVHFEFRAYDTNYQLFYTNTGSAIFTATMPGQLNPFEVGANVRWDDPRLLYYELIITDWKMDSLLNYIPLTIVFTPTISYWTDVPSETYNDSTQVVTDVRACVWSMDEAYNIFGEKVADSLAPGESVTHTFYLHGVGEASVIHAAAQGILP